MCIIAYHKGKDIIPYEWFYNSIVNNPDSYGLYYFNVQTKKRIIRKTLPYEHEDLFIGNVKDIDYTERICTAKHYKKRRESFSTFSFYRYASRLFNEYYQLVKKANPDDIFIIHNRIATRGKVNLDNCQPFVSEKTGFVFAHNGTLDLINCSNLSFVQLYEKLDKNDDYWEDFSDSRIFFYDFFVPLIENTRRCRRNPYIYEMINFYFYEANSKGVIFDEVSEEVYLLNPDKWTYKSGVYFSNSSYEKIKTYKTIQITDSKSIENKTKQEGTKETEKQKGFFNTFLF